MCLDTISEDIMQILMSAEEIIDRGLWDDYCEITGTNVYAVKEGMDDQEMLVLPVKLHKYILRKDIIDSEYEYKAVE